MNTLLGVVGTNKSYRLGDMDKSQVVFKVASDSNKIRVRKAVTSLFGVDVISVNILNCKGKSRRFAKTVGKTKGHKKAIVTLKEGDEIDFGSKSAFSKKKDKAKKAKDAKDAKEVKEVKEVKEAKEVKDAKSKSDAKSKKTGGES